MTAAARRAWLAGAVVACAALLAFLLWPRDEPPRARSPSAVRSPEVAASSRHRRAPRTRPRRPASGQSDAATAALPADSGTWMLQPSAARATPTTRVEQLQTTVLQSAVKHDWVAIDEHDNPCPPERIRIVYELPPELATYTKGAYFEPLGPAPSASSEEVNGLLVCEGSTFLYRGFEAYYRHDREQWEVYPFPVIE